MFNINYNCSYLELSHLIWVRITPFPISPFPPLFSRYTDLPQIHLSFLGVAYDHDQGGLFWFILMLLGQSLFSTAGASLRSYVETALLFTFSSPTPSFWGEAVCCTPLLEYSNFYDLV
jgi:hypothetical protein